MSKKALPCERMLCPGRDHPEFPDRGVASYFVSTRVKTQFGDSRANGFYCEACLPLKLREWKGRYGEIVQHENVNGVDCFVEGSEFLVKVLG